MSRAQGINTNFNKVLGLMVSNGLVALSSALLAQYQGFADVNMGRGLRSSSDWPLSSSVKRFSDVFSKILLCAFWLLLLGSILYYLVLQTVIWLGIDTDLLKLLSALVVAVFLAHHTEGTLFFKACKTGREQTCLN